MSMTPHHLAVARAVARNPVHCTLTRIGPSEDLSASLNITPVQFQEQAQSSGGSVEQATRKWMIPALALAATDFPLPPRAGDLLHIPMLNEHFRVDLVVPGLAGGEVTRWDVSVTGGGL